MTLDAADIRQATPADEDAIVTTVVAAFENDPAFRFFFPSDQEYAAQAPIFIRALFRSRTGRNSIWVLPDAEGNIISLAMWSSPNVDAHPSLDGLSTGALARLKQYNDATDGGLPDGNDFWYLGILATHPDHWGNAYGRALMKPGLARAAGEGRAAYLETTTASNVAMYQRAGWAIAADTPVDDLTVTVLAVL